VIWASSLDPAKKSRFIRKRSMPSGEKRLRARLAEVPSEARKVRAKRKRIHLSYKREKLKCGPNIRTSGSARTATPSPLQAVETSRARARPLSRRRRFWASCSLPRRRLLSVLLTRPCAAVRTGSVRSSRRITVPSRGTRSARTLAAFRAQEHDVKRNRGVAHDQDRDRKAHRHRADSTSLPISSSVQTATSTARSEQRPLRQPVLNRRSRTCLSMLMSG
jgi:hypothetical protein